MGDARSVSQQDDSSADNCNEHAPKMQPRDFEQIIPARMRAYQDKLDIEREDEAKNNPANNSHDHLPSPRTAFRSALVD